METVEENLLKRGVQFHRYDLTFDDETASFPLYTPTLNRVGYQQYRPSADKTRKNDPKMGRYYTRVTKGYNPIFGFETLEYDFPYVFLVEGVFKSVRLHRFGLPALGVLGNDPKPCLQQIRLLGRKPVSLCDPDVAGKRLAKFGDYSFTMKDKPLDDLTDKETADFLEELDLWSKNMKCWQTQKSALL